MLFVVCCLLRVAVCSWLWCLLLDVWCLLLVVCLLWLADGCSLFVVCRALFVVRCYLNLCWFLPVCRSVLMFVFGFCVLYVARCLLFVVGCCWLRFVICRLLSVRCLLFVVGWQYSWPVCC